MHKPTIRLEGARATGGEVTFKASFDRPLERYLRSDILSLSYDAAVEGVEAGLLAVPFVTTMVTVAWATGADLEVPTLDRTFLDSMGEVRQVLKRWYPRLSFDTTIKVDRAEEGDALGRANEGLLYSGGIDSTASLIRHLDVRPVLMLVIGTPDLPLSQTGFQQMFLEAARPFVESLGSKLHVVRTGMLDVVNLEALNEDFGRSIGSYWWESVSHGMMLMGTCAPLTAIEGIRRLRIASSRIELFEEPWGSNPELDQKLAWKGTEVLHDSHDISRQDKIEGLLAPFIRAEGANVPLRVCGSAKSRERVARRTLNCGRCEKCVRTIVGLLAGGIDPTTCGFDMEFFSANTLRRNLEEGTVMLPKSVWDLWLDIQTSIRKQETETAVPSLYNSRSFFEWMRGYDLERNLYRPSLATRLLGSTIPRFSARRKSAELIRDFKRKSPGAQVSVN